MKKYPIMLSVFVFNILCFSFLTNDLELIPWKVLLGSILVIFLFLARSRNDMLALVSISSVVAVISSISYWNNSATIIAPSVIYGLITTTICRMQTKQKEK